jgi:IPT/TIG domain
MALGTADSQASITLGQTSTNSLDFFSVTASSEVETASGQSPSYTVPAGGVITSWSNQADAMSHGEIKLKVYRPTAEPDRLTVVDESAAETITPGQLNSFPTHIPVQAGDVLGSTRTPGTTMSTFFFTTTAGDMAAQASGADDPLGSTTSFAPPQGDVRLNISAVLRQQPAVSSIEPSSGPLTGSTLVTINGHDFTDATAVSFGSAPAASSQSTRMTKSRPFHQSHRLGW